MVAELLATSRLRRIVAYARHGVLLHKMAAAVRLRWHKRRWDMKARQGGTVDVELEPGLSLRLDYSDHVGVWVIIGDYEPDERAFVTGYLRPEEVFLDIGANIGLFTVLAARRVPRGEVHAFEPCEPTYRRLVDNVTRNGLGNVRCNRMALSDSAGVGTMTYGREGYHTYSSMAHPLHGTSFSQERVECVTLDGYVKENQLTGRVALIKIDVEGWEHKVIKAGQAVLSRPDAPALLAEFNQTAARLAGSSCEELYRMLQDLGYQMFFYNSQRSVLEYVPLYRSWPWSLINLVASKDPEGTARRVGARLHLAHPRGHR